MHNAAQPLLCNHHRNQHMKLYAIRRLPLPDFVATSRERPSNTYLQGAINYIRNQTSLLVAE